MSFYSHGAHFLRQITRHPYHQRAFGWTASRLDAFADAPLPPMTEWRSLFPTNKHKLRTTISNPRSAALVAEAIVPSDSRDKIIIEAYAGPGVLTRALMNLPKGRISKILVIEDSPFFCKHLYPLAEIDSRVKIIEKSPFIWDTYDSLDMDYLKDVESAPWSVIHPQLHYVAQLGGDSKGEQLLSQFVRSIPTKQWLFKYGRVPMHFLTSDHEWSRLMGEPLSALCKLSVITKASASCQLCLPISVMQPWSDHFFPKLRTIKTSPRTTKCLVGIVPHEHQAIEVDLMEKWDYVLRRLFVRRATPLEKSIADVGPGALSLCSILEEKHGVDMSKCVRDLSIADWVALIKVFDEWEFAPDNMETHMLDERM